MASTQNTKSQLADLARQLGGIKLDSRPSNLETHIFTIEYPVAELQQDGEKLQLEEPTLITQRDAPPADPAAIGIYDTSFFAILPVLPRDPFFWGSEHDTAVFVQYAVDLAATAAGRTTIEVARWQNQSTLNIVTRIRLQVTHNGQEMEPLQFALDENEWQKLLKQKLQVPWIRLLENLVTRASARAYYHVRNRLYAACGELEAAAEEASWSAKWATKLPRNIRQRLFARVLRRRPNAPYEAKESYLNLRFPCGHTWTERRITLLAMSDEGCAHYRCKECGRDTKKPGDFREAMMHEQLRRARAYVLGNDEWHTLDQQIVPDDEPIKVSANGLLCALAAALGSMTTPAMIAPSELSFLNLPQTEAVFAGIEEQLDELPLQEVVTAYDVYEGLLSFAKEIVHGTGATVFDADQLPPGWPDELCRWLTRTTRLIADRGCTRRGEKHIGLHKHGEELFCGLLDDDEEDMDEEAGAEPVTSMAELTSLMGSLTHADSLAQHEALAQYDALERFAQLDIRDDAEGHEEEDEVEDSADLEEMQRPEDELAGVSEDWGLDGEDEID